MSYVVILPFKEIIVTLPLLCSEWYKTQELTKRGILPPSFENEYVIEHDPTLWSSTLALQFVSRSLRFELRLILWLRFPWCFPVLFQDNFRTGKEFQLIAVESFSHRIPKMFTSLDTGRTSVNFYLRVVFPDIFVLEDRSYSLSGNFGDKLLLPQWNFP